MLPAQHGFEPACERGVDQQTVKVHRHLRHGDAVWPGRDRPVQIGQRLFIIERGNFGHKAAQQIEDPAALDLEERQRLPPVAPDHLIGPLKQCLPCPLGLIRGRQKGQRQIGPALEMIALGLEFAAPLLIDQPGGRVGKLLAG
jgi:hypothetical protein